MRPNLRDPRPCLLTLAAAARAAGEPMSQAQIAWIAAVIEPRLADVVQAFDPSTIFFEIQGQDGVQVVVEARGSASVHEAFVAPELRGAGLALRSSTAGHFALAAVVWWALTGEAPTIATGLAPLELNVDGELELFLREILRAPSATARAAWIDGFRSTLLALGDFEAPLRLRSLVDGLPGGGLRSLMSDELPIDSSPLPVPVPPALGQTVAFHDTIVIDTIPPPLPRTTVPPPLPVPAEVPGRPLAWLEVGEELPLQADLVSLPPRARVSEAADLRPQPSVAVDERPTGDSFSVAAPVMASAAPRLLPRLLTAAAVVALGVGGVVVRGVAHAEPPRRAESFAAALPEVDVPEPPPPPAEPCALEVSAGNPYLHVAVDGEDRGPVGDAHRIEPGTHEVQLLLLGGRALPRSQRSVACENGEAHTVSYR